MKTLRQLSKYTFLKSLIIFSIFFSSVIAEDEPIDIWKIRIERGRFQSLIGEKKVYHFTRFDQRITISQNWDIRLEVKQMDLIEGILALHYFW